MKSLKILLITVVVLLFSNISNAQTPDIQISGNSIVITPPTSENFYAMDVIIMSPSHKFLINARSYGDVISQTVFEDGDYRWEVKIILLNPNAKVSSSERSDELIVKTFTGTFTVKGGIITNFQKPKNITANFDFYLKKVTEKIIFVLRKVVEFVATPAYALNDTRIYLSDIFPSIYFDDNANNSSNPSWGNFDWFIYVDNATSSTAGNFYIVNNQNYYVFFRIDSDGNTGKNNLAIWVQNDGDITFKNQTHIIKDNKDVSFSNDIFVFDYNQNSLGTYGNMDISNGALFVDGSANYVGIGTSTPAYSLEIHNTWPEIKLLDLSDSTAAHIEYNAGILSLEGNSQQNIVEINATAPKQSITIDSTGTVNMKNVDVLWSGTNSNGDGLSKLVSLSANNVDTNKTSDVGFSLYNARADFRWNFRTASASKGFMATKQGTGGAEFEIRNTTNSYQNVSLHLGNGAYCSSTGQWINASSREYKEDIKPLSAEVALKAFEKLNPVTFKFKRDKNKEVNVGFIAEEVPDIVASPDRKGINSLEVVALLTKVVKEQQRIIQEQAKQLEKQKTLIYKQRKQLDEQTKINKNLYKKIEEIQKQIQLLHSTALKINHSDS